MSLFNNFIQLGCIKLIKSDSTDFCISVKNKCFLLENVYDSFQKSSTTVFNIDIKNVSWAPNQHKK